MSVKETMTRKLEAAFAPASLTVLDESDQHHGHGGWREGGETHFRVSMRAAAFDGMTRVARSRAVHAALADELAGGATQAIRWTKVVANMPLVKLAHELMDPSVAYEMASNRTADHHEAVRAFAEKRAPRWTGR